VQATSKAPWNRPILALSLVGMALTAYLSWAASSGGGVQGCGIDSGCDTVLSSRWATLLGVPTAMWGLLAYGALAASAFIRRADWQWIAAWTLSFFGLLYSVYLTTVSVALLGATCPYCLTSLTIMTAVFVVATRQRPTDRPGFAWRRILARAVPAAATVIALLHLNYVGILGRPPAGEDTVARARAVRVLVSALRRAEGALRRGRQAAPLRRVQLGRSGLAPDARVPCGRHQSIPDLDHRRTADPGSAHAHAPGGPDGLPATGDAAVAAACPRRRSRPLSRPLSVTGSKQQSRL
jgi:uncharacterized membrane protein